MKASQDRVELFMRKAEQECPYTPIIPNEDVQLLRLKLIQEELNELEEAFAHKNLVDCADAIGDLLVVVLGTAVACGMNSEPIFNEVMDSNLSKFIDGYKRNDGKWIKGPSYRPAELKHILWDQLHPVQSL